MPRIAVVIAAAGGSTRFGGAVKKPFVTLAGQPIWHRAVDLFARRADVARVYLVLGRDDLAEFRQRHGAMLMLAYESVELVEGGAERFESVANALARVPAEIDLVAIHDAVRCLTAPALIDAVVAAAAQHGGAMPAVPAADTLKRVDPATRRVTGTVPRADLWQAQTPQVFRRDWLVEAYATRDRLAGPITDDAQLMEAAGHAVYVVPGSPLNFKITTADDLRLAEALLRPAPAEPPAARHPFADDPE